MLKWEPRHAALKAVLRKVARQAKRNGDTERQALAEKALADPMLFELTFANEVLVVEDSDDLILDTYGNPLLDFLQALWERREEILEFILRVLDLLSVEAMNEGADPGAGN